MNSFVSISFVFFFLVKGIFPGIDLDCEIQKIPHLLDHYKEHKTNNEWSFWQFLEEHYLNNDDSESQHEDPEHENLPFHGNQHCCHPALFFVSEQHISVSDLEQVIQTNFSFYKAFPLLEFLDSLFHPPQI